MLVSNLLSAMVLLSFIVNGRSTVYYMTKRFCEWLRIFSGRKGREVKDLVSK